jgi:hypothetical protein
MNIHILTVPNEEIKIRKGFTGADWWWDESGDLQVRVASELEDWRERAALMIHEAGEALMCRHLGVTVAQVDDFDAKFEREHPGDGTTNVGDISDCPYRLPHNAATAMERVLTTVLNVEWQAYDDRLSKL